MHSSTPPDLLTGPWTQGIKRRAITQRKFTLPSWWMALAPGQPAAFWIRVERARQEAGVHRSDTDGMSYIIRNTPRRMGRSTKGVEHDRRK